MHSFLDRTVVLLLLILCTATVLVESSATTTTGNQQSSSMGNEVSSSSGASATSSSSQSSMEEPATTTTTAPTTPVVIPHVHVEGISWPMEKDLEHVPVTEQDQTTTRTKLRFNGAGVRSISIFGWDFKVYVASFYHAVPMSSSPLMSTAQVYQAVQEHAMQFDFTFLRTFAQGQVTEAWQRQLEHSVEHRYDDYEQDRDAFIASFGPIVNGGTVSVALHPCGRTVLIDQGTRKNTIQSRNFQRAFLSMWFGEKAVHPDLKQGLLGAGHWVKQQHYQHDGKNVEERTVDMTGQ